MAVLIAMSLAACGGSPASLVPETGETEKPEVSEQQQESKPEQEQAEPESQAVPEESVPSPEEAAKEAAENTLGDIHVESDDSHYVVSINGMKMSYEFSGNDITGCVGYVDCGSAEAALAAVSQYVDGSDPSVKSVYAAGQYVAMVMNESEWEGLTLEALKALYSYLG